jgi:hypothetical protein
MPSNETYPHIDQGAPRKVAVPAGIVAPKVPRPLTDDERRVLRERAGGDASPEEIAQLAEAFAKPRNKRQDLGVVSLDRNGWR